MIYDKIYKDYLISHPVEDIKLDLKDWKILGILCTDARTPNTKIAKRVGLSVEAVGYRIRKLEESGVIRKYGIYPDELKINIKTFFVFLKFTTMSEHDENRFIEIFTKHQNVGVVWESSGNWDFILIIYAADIFIFAKIIDDLLSRVARHLKEYKSLFALEQIKFTQLIGEELKAFKDPYATITPLEKRLDTLIITDKEKKLLSYLDDHGRASAVAISKH